MDPVIWKQGNAELNRDRSQLALVVQALEQTAPLAAKLTGHDSFSLDEGRLALQLIELVLHIQKESAVIHEVVAALGGLCETGADAGAAKEELGHLRKRLASLLSERETLFTRP